VVVETPKEGSFDDLYAELLGQDKRASKLAEEEIKRRWEEFLPDLIEVAKKLDPETSAKAIEIIGYYEHEEIPGVILQGLESPNRDILVASLIAAGRQDVPEIGDKLLEYTYSEDSAIRGNAASALSNYYETPGVLARLRELAVDPEIGVRMAAYSGLGKAGDPESKRLLFDALKREAELMPVNPQQASLLVLVVTQALGNVVDESDCEWLVDGLDAGNSREFRNGMFDVIGSLYCSEAVDKLIAITRDINEDDMTRFRAGFTLAFIGDLRGYKAADDIHFAADQGLLKIDEANFPTFRNTMSQYYGLLEEMKKAQSNE
jgi:HEAT repeat protein